MKNNIQIASGVLVALFSATSAFANETASADLFRDFSKCDAGFFKTLNEKIETFQEISPIAKSNGVGYFKNENRFSKNSAVVDFKAPLIVNNLPFTSYFEDYSDLGSLGKYYYWGFLTKETSVDEVKKKLGTSIYDNERMTKDAGVYSRTEVKVLSSPWLRIQASKGAVGLSRVERLFSIEKDPETSQIRVSCSIQGGVNADTLKEIRPDIEDKYYPKTISRNLFDEVVMPTNVMAEVNRVKKSNPVLTPKFKTIRYTYQSLNSTKPNTSREKAITIELKALPNGLVHRKEIYDPAFTVDRLLLADMFQLKSRMNGLSDGSVYLTTELKIDFPKAWPLGGVVKTTWKGAYRPERVEDTDTSPIDENTCVISNKIPAREIFASMKGTAIIMDCDNSKEQKAYLDAYGIEIGQKDIDKKDGSITEYKILEFVVE